jgi:hypothetical protein
VVPAGGAELSGEGEEHHREAVGGGEGPDRAGERVTYPPFRKLYSEYLDFKASILSLLCYVELSQQLWAKALRTASTYQQFQSQYQLHSKNAQHQQIYYTVLTYKMEAESQMGHTLTAYKLMQEIVANIEYADSAQLTARSTITERKG